MTKRKRQSSRLRSEQRRRMRGAERQRPGNTLKLVRDPILKKLMEVEVPNRAKRKMDSARKRGAVGQSRRQEAQQTRRMRLQRARIRIKEIRLETRRAMRAAR